jgi:two-component system, NtrC family, response regulator AtoC
VARIFNINLPVLPLLRALRAWRRDPHPKNILLKCPFYFLPAAHGPRFFRAAGEGDAPGREDEHPPQVPGICGQENILTEVAFLRRITEFPGTRLHAVSARMMYNGSAMGNILVVDDNPSILELVDDVLKGTGHALVKCSNGVAGLEAFHSEVFDLVIADLAMPVMDGFQLISEIRALYSDIPIIMITGVGGVDEAVKAMKKGASDFMIKPFQPDEFRVRVVNTLAHYALKKEVERLKREKGVSTGVVKIVGESPLMKKLVAAIQQVSQSNASILVSGESGTGKELIARAIHEESERRDRAFIPIDCSTLSENIIESELFGHVKGAFTGADRTKRGLLEEANNGTIFLDEIGNLTWQVQSKLLRFLQEREFKPVGSSKLMKVNVRIISATNVDLRKEIEKGGFREDLFYRLSGIEITIPPLRDRLDDLPYLIKHFIQKYATDLGKKVDFIDNEALEILKQRKWNGNIRELEHLIEHALIVETGPRISADTVLHVLPEVRSVAPASGTFEPDLAAAVGDFEKAHIIRVIQLARNNKAKAARLLGISRSVLYEKLKKYGVE